MTWDEIVARLQAERTWWLITSGAGGPHAAPVWGVGIDGQLYLYTWRSSVKGRNLASTPRAVVHTEDGERPLIVTVDAHDRGAPVDHPSVVAAYRAKYSQPRDAAYVGELADGAPDLVLLQLTAVSALAWELDDFESSMRRFPAKG